MKRNKSPRIAKNKSPGIIILIVVLIIILASILVYTFLKPFNKNNNLCGPTLAGSNHDLSYCDTSCKSESDCKYECGCGALNKNEDCDTGKIMYDCYGLMQVKCVDDNCAV